MFRSAKQLQHYRIHATDGDLGQARDLYFDDHRWTIRHLVVTTSHWLPRHRVLVPRASFRKIDDAHNDCTSS